MKKIIGIIHPFDMLQTFYVYEDGNKLETIQTQIKDIPNTILNLVNTYDIDQVDLSGAEHFNKGIIDQIEQNVVKYTKHKLTIKCI